MQRLDKSRAGVKISDGNDTLMIHKRTSCKHKCAGDNQRRGCDFVDAKMRRGRSEIGIRKSINTPTMSGNAQVAISNRNEISAREQEYVGVICNGSETGSM